MKSSITLTLILLFLFSCQNNTRTNSTAAAKTDSTASKAEIPKENLKTLNEVKLILLDARVEKAQLLLNKPDEAGRLNLTAGLDYMVYFDKVLDEGIKKHLVLVINTLNGTIIGVDAVREGFNERWGFRSFNVSRKGLSSESTDFTTDYSKNSASTPQKDNGEIRILDALPMPSEAIKKGEKLKIIGFRADDVFNYYKKYYKIGNVMEHDFFLAVTPDKTETCALAHFATENGVLTLSFTNECGGL